MRWPRFWVRCGFIGLTSLLPATPAQAQVVTVLHSFGGGPSDGAFPSGSLVASNSMLYGMTYYGGSSNFGTAFQIALSGNSFDLLHSFGGGPNDGAYPAGSLTQSGSTLFGMTEFGGSFSGGNGPGTIFQIGVNGAGFNLLHSFTRSATDGGGPLGSLVQSGQTLFGLTQNGGSNAGSVGTVFKIGADGNAFSVQHSFASGSGDGYYPSGSLVQIGATLYGMAKGGGVADQGVIFRIGTDGSGYTVIHSFAGGDGAEPVGSLTLSGSTLFGMTLSGGTAGVGTIFRIEADGSGFATLHSFIHMPTDGFNPGGSLVLSGSTLYGMTASGGSTYDGSIFGNTGDGTLFQILTDGSNYSVLHSFMGGPSDGAGPNGDLTVSGSNLYGMTGGGGSNNTGTIFSFPIPVPEPSSPLLAAAGASLALLARRRRGRRLLPSGQL